VNIRSPLEFSVFCTFNSILDRESAEPPVFVDCLDNVKLEALYRLLRVTPSFVDFARWFESNDHTLAVISQGCTPYVEQTLARHGINVPVFSNTLSIKPDGSRAIETPWKDAGCERCPVCTRNILVTHSSDMEVVVFIGSDAIDVCPAKYADVVFARGPLETACREENVTYRQFRSFLEIKNHLEALMERGRFKVPERARVRRKELWKHE